MKFDCTKGQSVRYGVSVYGWNVEDMYYFHYYKDAKEMFNKLKEKGWSKGTALSIYDMQKDERKEFVRF